MCKAKGWKLCIFLFSCEKNKTITLACKLFIFKILIKEKTWNYYILGKFAIAYNFIVLQN